MGDVLVCCRAMYTSELLVLMLLGTSVGLLEEGGGGEGQKELRRYRS